MLPVLLIAEDDDTDAALLLRALRRTKLPLQPMRVSNGDEVIRYLEGKPPYDDREKYPIPSVLLLDLRMPYKDGFEVLRWRRQVRAGTRVPVVVFSSSSMSEDISHAYDLGANSYVIKPTGPGQLESIVTALHEWWENVNVRPRA